MDDRLPKDYLQSIIEEKAEMIRKYMRDMGFQPILDTVWPPSNFIGTKRNMFSNYISPSPI